MDTSKFLFDTMSHQRTNIRRDEHVNHILDLEVKYFNILEKILKSKEFTDDLLLIEKEISDNYRKFDKLWNLKNKIKVPAERVVRHHLYLQMNDLIKGIFPSPLSSDYGVRTNDAVICVDIKTIDTDNNSGDLSAISVEKNQTSFDNKNHPYVPIPHNMNEYDDYKRLPILTYVVRIVYTDNKVYFSLCRDKSLYTISLTCVPNGKLSELFAYDIVDNCKTYEYYSPKNDGPQYEPIWLSESESRNDSIIFEKCKARGLRKIDSGKKHAYRDDKTGAVWWKTTINKKNCIAPVKNGSSVRFNIDYLEHRYDSKDRPWAGYKHWIISDNHYMSGQLSLDQGNM